VVCLLEAENTAENCIENTLQFYEGDFGETKIDGGTKIEIGKHKGVGEHCIMGWREVDFSKTAYEPQSYKGFGTDFGDVLLEVDGGVEHYSKVTYRR
jgi:hypothetical protein